MASLRDCVFESHASGPVVGGVLGRSTLHFSVVGQTINLAARTASAASSMSILVGVVESFKESRYIHI